MPNHIPRIKKKMSIYAKRKVKNILSGNYGSVFKGRGMDFDDLRAYEYGDDVKDIDWKASARSKTPMIRRYTVIRKHNIMIVVDSGRNMAALSPSGESKAEIATFAAGVIAYIANKNSDLIGMTFGNNSNTTRFALKEGLANIENFLNKYEKSVSLSSDKPNLNSLLSYILKNYRERMFLIIISDDFNISNISLELIRKLRIRHEQMFIMIEDSALTNPNFIKDETREISDNLRLPRYIRKNHKLMMAETKMRDNMHSKISHDLKRLGICSCLIRDTDTAIPKIFKMLEEQKHVRR